MQFRGKKKVERLERLKMVLTILLGGWVTYILKLIVSYTILTRTLETKILSDRQAFVQLIAHLIGDDLGGKSTIIEYYQTLPDVAKNLTNPNAAAGQQWINQTFFSHPRVDGMFMTMPDGRLIASVPYDPELIGKDFGSDYWREQATPSNKAFVSAVHPRLSDKRMVTYIVGSVRAADQTIIRYIGVY